MDRIPKRFLLKISPRNAIFFYLFEEFIIICFGVGGGGDGN